jgi:hypothetical protein
VLAKDHVSPEHLNLGSLGFGERQQLFDVVILIKGPEMLWPVLAPGDPE